MNRYPLWRYILIIIMIAVGVIYALPNLYGDNYAIQMQSRQDQPITSAFATEVSGLLKQHSIPFISVKPEEKDLLIRFNLGSEQSQARDLLQAAFGKKYSVALNLAPRTPQWLQRLGATPMHLGLDLRGGIHFLLYVNIPAMLKERIKQDTHGIANALREKNIRYTGLTQVPGKSISVKFKSIADLKKANSLLSTDYSDYDVATNTDNNTFSATLSFNPKALVNISQNAIAQNITTLRTKVNELGVSEPVIRQQGKNHISVDLPGIQDTARAQQMIGKMATIKLLLVDQNNDAQQAAASGIVPFGDTLYTGPNGAPILLKNDVVLDGRSITGATSILDQQYGRPAVSVQTSGAQVARFYRITGENVGKPMATVLVETKTSKKLVDGKVVYKTMPVSKVVNVATIQTALSNFVITGLSSTVEANDLALQLRSGAYSAPVVYAQTQIVGPSLGAANIRHGVLSCAIGSLLVIIFMMLYYRLFGVIANGALILNVVFVVAVMSILGATMTLPGIAGIVLTVGMAVDANVLINERIREELRLGMSPQAAIFAGYERAFSTIVDANVTTLIVAVILFSLGTGPVKGFAITLAIGLVTSMITAIFFTRAVVNLIYGGRSVKHLSIGIKLK